MFKSSVPFLVPSLMKSSYQSLEGWCMLWIIVTVNVSYFSFIKYGEWTNVVRKSADERNIMIEIYFVKVTQCI